MTTTAVAATSTNPPTSANDGLAETDEAKIDITYTGDGTTYSGDRNIVEGTVTIMFSNESEGGAIGILLWYETGSAALAEELDFLEEEGAKGVPIGEPAEGYVEIELEGVGDLAPGGHTWTVDLKPGTYIFDVGPPGFHATGLWRAAIIEVVPEV